MKDIYELLINLKNKIINHSKEEAIEFIDKKLEDDYFEVNIKEAIQKAKAEKLFSEENKDDLLKRKKYQIIPTPRKSYDYHYLLIQSGGNIEYSITLEGYISADDGPWGHKLKVYEFEVGHPHSTIIYAEENRVYCEKATKMLTIALVELIRYLRKTDPSIKELLY